MIETADGRDQGSSFGSSSLSVCGLTLRHPLPTQEPTMPTPTAEVYRDGRWTIIEITTDEGRTRRRCHDEGIVEHQRYDPETDVWLFHGPCWSDDGLHEEWVDGELVSSINTDAGYRMRVVAGTQIVNSLVENP